MSASLVLGTAALEGAGADGDTRTISIFNVHTNENATVTFKRNGYYDAEGLKQLSWILRDWRRDEPTNMSPRLFDILWEVHQELGSQEPFHAVSGYRSPTTNAMLRRASSLVAEHSQHMLGRAMDSFLPDVSISHMREVAMHLQMGGVGFYPTSGSPFVHIDAGSVRAWPRMTREQLARLFPDGKTVHLPTDGHPFPGYEQAKAEILARGGTVAGYGTYAENDPALTSGGHKSLWAMLFGGADEDEDNAMASGGRGVTSRTASRQQTQVASLAPMNGDDNGVRAILLAQNQTPASVQEAMPAPSRSRGRATVRTTPPAEQPAPASAGVAVASTQPSSGVTSFLDALRGATSATAATTQPGTTAVERADAQAQANTTVATREEAQLPESDAKPATAIASYAPLPPRRSNVFAEVASLANIPVPPTRPASLDAGEPKATEDGAPSTEMAEAAKLVALDHPLPPSRPEVFAFALPRSDTALTDNMPTGSIQPPDAKSLTSAASLTPSLTGKLVPLDHPMPPSRPIQFAMAGEAAGQPTTAPTGAVPPAPVARLDKNGLLALFETAALVPAHRPIGAPVKVANATRAALPRAAQEVIAQPATAAGHFSALPVQPVLNHFSGKAVQPLSALGFVKSE